MLFLIRVLLLVLLLVCRRQWYDLQSVHHSVRKRTLGLDSYSRSPEFEAWPQTGYPYISTVIPDIWDSASIGHYRFLPHDRQLISHKSAQYMA